VWQTCIDATMSDTSLDSRKAAIDTCADVVSTCLQAARPPAGLQASPNQQHLALQQSGMNVKTDASYATCSVAAPVFMHANPCSL
jgi:hypothetical protein